MSEIDGLRRVLAGLIRVVDDLAAEVEAGRRDLIAQGVRARLVDLSNSVWTEGKP